MHPQLQAVIDELGTAQARLHALAAAIPPTAWSRRPDPARWSIAECGRADGRTGGRADGK